MEKAEHETVDKGGRLRSIRMDLDIGQADFSKLFKSKPSVGTIQNWEQNKFFPSIDEFDDFPRLGINAIPYITGSSDVRYMYSIENVKERVSNYLMCAWTVPDTSNAA